MHIVRILLGTALTLVLVPITSTATAGGREVTAYDDYFDPESVSIGRGGEVTWTNDGEDLHDTMSDETNPDGTAGIGLWSSPPIAPGVGSFSQSIHAAGIYPYHCTLHEGMTGKIGVTLFSIPDVGSLNTSFVIYPAGGDADKDFAFDVQRRDPGQEEFHDWVMGSTTNQIPFEPSSAGVFQFRARLHRVSTDGASMYSSPMSLEVVDNVRDVLASDGAYDPVEARVRLGEGVLWRGGIGNHSATSLEFNQDSTKGIALWDSDMLTGGRRYAFWFTASGTYPYHCRRHSFMVGYVVVPVQASPVAGPTGTTFQIRVAGEPAASGFVYDVQKRDPGGTFENWRRGVRTARVAFRPHDPGRYQFRARLRRVSDGGVSYYSPHKTVVVT